MAFFEGDLGCGRNMRRSDIETVLFVITGVGSESLYEAKTRSLSSVGLESAIIGLVFRVSRLSDVLEPRVLFAEELDSTDMVDVSLGGDDITDVVRLRRRIAEVLIVDWPLKGHARVDEYASLARFEQVRVRTSLGHYDEVIDAFGA